MPTITFQMIHSGDEFPIFSVDVAPGTTLLDAAKQCNLPLEHACEGYCACATCHVVILEGHEQLPLATSREEDMLDCAWDATLGSRLSCQVKVGQHPLRVLIPKYSLNPAKMVQRFPFIWDPSKKKEEISLKKESVSKTSGCKNCPCSRSKNANSLDWEDAQAIAELLNDRDSTCDPSVMRFTELHQRICELPEFSGQAERSTESTLEKILQEWLNLKG